MEMEAVTVSVGYNTRKMHQGRRKGALVLNQAGRTTLENVGPMECVVVWELRCRGSYHFLKRDCVADAVPL